MGNNRGPADAAVIEEGTSPYHRPRSTEELTRRNVETVARIEETARAARSPADRIAISIARFCGSMAFVWVHTIWFVAWIVINSVLPKKWHFDPFPFAFLTLVVSLEAIFLSMFILIAQNQQERVADRRNHLDLQINLLSEQENTKMLAMLESIQRRLGITEGDGSSQDDPDVKILEESTRPERMVEQIEEILDHKEAHKKAAHSGV